MSYPILFGPNGEPAVGTSLFMGNGYGVLSDALSCVVTEERNGGYELERLYPIKGIHYELIAQRCILFAETHPGPGEHNISSIQPFRIYRITKPLNGKVTVYAAHFRYDLAGAVLTPCTAHNAAGAMAAVKNNSVGVESFRFYTDKSTEAEMEITVPCSVQSQLAGKSGSILDLYKGEYQFDAKVENNALVCNVHLWNARGYNRGVTIRYGKNLTDLKQDENCASAYTGVFPYWSGDSITVVGDPLYLGNFDYKKLKVVDFSSDFESAPTKAQLAEAASAYATANQIGVPTVSLTVSYIQLAQSTEYANLALLEHVLLCDTVNVYFEKLGVNATAKVVKTVYNVILERYDSIEIGEAKTSVADTIVNQQREIENPEVSSSLRDAINRATNAITGNLGGYVVIHDSNEDGKPDEILIMDSPSIASATKVWRWNNSGLGYSSTGYAGPYETAITADGEIVANFMTTGTLDASQVTVINLNAGSITSGTIDASKITVKNLDASEIKSGSLSANYIVGGTLDANQVSVINLNASNITSGTIDGNSINVINLNASNITSGSLSANFIRGGTIDANTINVDNLNASNLKFGYVAAGRISYAGNHLASLYVTSLYAMGNYSGTLLLVDSSSPSTWNSTFTRLTRTGVSTVSGGSQTATKSWADILAGVGSAAVFG